MTLHVLFGHHKLNFYGPEWWALHSDITKTWRTERTCREDYKYSHGKERTKMYPDRILKRYSAYDAEERAAHDKAFQDVIDSAKRQGITLPGTVSDEDEEVETGENEEGEEDKEAAAGEDEDVESEESEEEESEESEDEGEEDGDAKDEDEETTSKKSKIPATAATTTRAASTQKKIVAKSKPTIAAGLSSANPIAVADSPAKTSVSVATSRGEPQTYGRTRSGKPAVEVKNEIAVAAKTPKRGSGRLMDHDDSLSHYVSSGLDSDVETQRKKPKNNPTEKAKNTAANGQISLSDIFEAPPKTSKKPHTNPKQPPQPNVGIDHGTSKKPKTQAPLNQTKSTKPSTRAQDQVGTPIKPATSRATLPPAPVTNKPSQPSTRAPNQIKEQVKPATSQATSPPGLATNKPAKPSTRAQSQIGEQVKPATSKATLPSALATSKPQADKTQVDRALADTPQADKAKSDKVQANKTQATDALTVHGEKYDEWCRTNLDRILFDEPYNMYPNQIKVPGKRAPPQDPLPSDNRVVNFFSDMFDGQLTKKLILSTLKKAPESEKPGRRLKKIYKTLIEKAEESSISPVYHLNKVFDSEESPFSNFRLASSAFGQGLKMLHMSDLDYTGVGNQQLVAFAKFKNRHLTFDDIKFIDPEDPVFKRGGCVHKLWVRQQECLILGECKKYNTAHVCIDLMVCHESQCPKCSKDEDFGTQPRLITSLPRVHSRHVLPGDQFEAPVPTMSLEFEKDYRGEFIVDLNIGVQSIKLWDGTAQDVVVCDSANCPGCVEAGGGTVETSKEERDRAYTKTGRL